jgi:hypothetical protein
MGDLGSDAVSAGRNRARHHRSATYMLDVQARLLGGNAL